MWMSRLQMRLPRLQMRLERLLGLWRLWWLLLGTLRLVVDEARKRYLFLDDSDLHAKQGMRLPLAHEVRPCLVYGDAVWR
jgi:hypothetical protein